MTETFMTTAEVAEMLRVPAETVRSWRCSSPRRGPKSFRIPGGRRILYATVDVQAWLRAAQEIDAA